jgi:N-acetylneuraminate synthase
VTSKPGFYISNRLVGGGAPPLVIAEIGINHGGSLDAAISMVDAAVSVGVEVIKHQTHVIDDEMSSYAKKVVPGNAEISIYEIMSKCALNEENEFSLKEYVQSKGIIFISTPFSRGAVDRIEAMNLPAYKIGSGECNNYPLIKYIASKGKPVILSTGMNNLTSIAKAVEILELNKIPHALLHTTNLYPTPFKLVRLGAMAELASRFPGAVVGLSDHTTNNYACLAAVALGAAILERHFTDDMSRVGPDIICSMDPSACRELIEGSQIIHQELGGRKEACIEEQVTIDFAFSTVVTIRPVKAGELFTEKNIWVKRPGIGAFSAERYESLLGKKAARDVDNDTHLMFDDVELK